MPQFAKLALIQKMERSGRLDRLSTDVRVLFRKRLRFDPNAAKPQVGTVSQPLRVGALTLGYLSLPASNNNERNIAYQHWLEMACKELSAELKAPQSPTSAALPSKIIQALRLIREGHLDALSLGDVAKGVDLSRERLSRLFHASVGITFSDYLNEVRIAEAKSQLTEGDQPITEVAYASGFQSLSQFNRRFRRAEGMNPSEYRRKYRAST